MAHSAAMRPFGFSQPTRVTPKSDKHVGMPIPTYESNHAIRSSDDPLCNSSQSRATALRSGVSQRTFPEEKDRSSRPSRTHERRRPARLQTSHNVQSSSLASPITMLSDLQLRSPPPDLPDDLTEKQLEQQLKDICKALRRVEADREKVQNQMVAGRADRHRIERELEETRRENQRLAARLEELLSRRNTSMKTPASARSDDAWGCMRRFMAQSMPSGRLAEEGKGISSFAMEKPCFSRCAGH
ncbi:hypothetical protein K439DRAFT_1657692 [Ramaria rubella]|nr:hypothetical protein K439DRAFT_1657692 [Ramaria rubella]